MTVNRAIVDKLLTNVSNKYMPTDYLSERILPELNVVQDTGKLAGYGNNHIRIGTFLHTGTGEYPRVDVYNRNNQGYVLEKHALATIITEEDFANVEQPYDAEKDATDDITSLLWTEKEVGLADTLGNTSIITNNVTLSGTDQYSDPDNSSPLEDFATARTAIENLVGQSPNKAVMSKQVYNQLAKHPQILDRLGFKYNKIGAITPQELAMVMQVEELLISGTLKNTAKEGQTDSIVPIWGKFINFMVSPKTAAKRQISLGYRVQRKNPRRVTKEDLKDPVGARKILIDDKYQQLISNANASYLIADAIA